MKSMSCAAVRRMLEAFHDDELPVGDQIAVGAHVEQCAECAESLAELRDVGAAFASWAPVRPVMSREQTAAFNATVVSRLRAENDASMLSRLRDMFDDVRLVYAGLGAATATLAFVIIVLGMMRFATSERPDSLAAIVTLVATPLDCENAVDLADLTRCRARWEERFSRAKESAEYDSVFALDSVVTHQSGHLTDLGVLKAGHRTASAQASTIEALLDSMTRLRLESGTAAVPVPGSVLWLVEHATVRAQTKPPLDPTGPPIQKKRAELRIARTASA